METEKQEQEKVLQVAREYEKKGYKVIVEPRGKDVPSFIKNYQPDIIASNKKETVVVEVTRRPNRVAMERLKNVADQINQQKGWRFELVVTAKEESDTTIKVVTEFADSNSTDKILKNIDSLITLKQYQAAFILSWASLESVSRQILLSDNKNLQHQNPLTVIKTLFSFGYISAKELSLLENLFEIRNKVVHGYQASNLNKDSIDKLIQLVKSLAQALKEK